MRLTYREAAALVAQRHPGAVVLRLNRRFKVISQMPEWAGGLDGGFLQVELSELCPTLQLAVFAAAESIESEAQPWSN